MADLTELKLREQFRHALQKGAQPVATNEAEARVIAAARADSRRQIDQYWMEEEEILAALGLKTLDQFSEVLPLLQSIGFPPVARSVKVGSILTGRKDVPTVRMQRFEYDRWMERFAAVAQQLGYRNR